MNDDEIDELLAARALHALDPDDARMLDAALAADEDLRRRAELDDETASQLAAATREVDPPASIRESLLDQIAEGPLPTPSDPDAGSGEQDDSTRVSPPADLAPADGGAHHRSRRRNAWTLAASIAVIAGIAVGGVVTLNLLDDPPAVEALDAIEQSDDARTASGDLAGGGTVELHWSSELDEAVVTGDGIPVLDDGQQYELWIIRDEAPVSAGIFDGGEQEPILLSEDVAVGDVLAVTVEDEGGSPTGAPTADPVVAVQLA